MFDNMEALMKLVGIDMTRGLKATAYLTNMDDAEVVLKVWLEECNWKEYPALSVVEVSSLPRGALMQVDLIAAAGKCNTKFYTIDSLKHDMRYDGPGDQIVKYIADGQGVTGSFQALCVPSRRCEVEDHVKSILKDMTEKTAKALVDCMVSEEQCNEVKFDWRISVCKPRCEAICSCQQIQMRLVVRKLRMEFSKEWQRVLNKFTPLC